MAIKAIRADGAKVEAVRFEVVKTIQCKYGIAKKYNSSEIVELLGETVHFPTLPDGTPEGRTCVRLPTLDGDRFADVGDYVVKTEGGSVYPCNPQDWKTDYEVCDD